MVSHTWIGAEDAGVLLFPFHTTIHISMLSFSFIWNGQMKLSHPNCPPISVHCCLLYMADKWISLHSQYHCVHGERVKFTCRCHSRHLCNWCHHRFMHSGDFPEYIFICNVLMMIICYRVTSKLRTKKGWRCVQEATRVYECVESNTLEDLL